MPGIKILNPLPGGFGYTTRGRAAGFVARGLAEFTKTGAIRFLNPNTQSQNAEIQASVKAWQGEPASEGRVVSWRGSRPPWSKPLWFPGKVTS
jgi:hypothetical protein